ncbi:MAG: protein YgfX [Gammaproteobacteria bacterium]
MRDVPASKRPTSDAGIRLGAMRRASAPVIAGQPQTAGFDGPVHLHLAPSAAVARLVALAHLAAVLVVAWVSSATAQGLVLGVFIGFHGVCVVRRLRAQRPDQIASLLLTRADTWQINLCDGRSFGATLERLPLVAPGLTAVVLRDERGRRHRVTLSDDAVPAQAFRRLRVRLRLPRGSA